MLYFRKELNLHNFLFVKCTFIMMQLREMSYDNYDTETYRPPWVAEILIPENQK